MFIFHFAYRSRIFHSSIGNHHFQWRFAKIRPKININPLLFRHTLLQVLIDWLIIKYFTPYRQYFCHITAVQALKLPSKGVLTHVVRTPVAWAFIKDRLRKPIGDISLCEQSFLSNKKHKWSCGDYTSTFVKKSLLYLLLGYDHGSLFESPSPKDAKPCCAKFG